MASIIAGIDIGGTNIDIGIMEEQNGKILHKFSIPAEVNSGPKVCCDRITAEIDRLLEAERLGRSDLSGIGLGVPGLVDEEKGGLITSPNLPESWYGYDLRSHMHKEFKVEVAIDNDANAVTLGEGWAGAAQGVKSFLVLTLGTGIGGGIVQDGRLVRGASGLAGELGHICIYPEGRKCGCGRKGCVEAYASSTGIIAQFTEQSGKDVSDAKEVFDLARQGDQVAKKVLKEAAKAFGIACGTLLNIFNPERIIISGRMAASFDLLAEQVRQSCKAHSFARPFKEAEILPSSLGASGGIIGAGALVGYHRQGNERVVAQRITLAEPHKILAAHIGVTGMRISLVTMHQDESTPTIHETQRTPWSTLSGEKPDVTPKSIGDILTGYTEMNHCAPDDVRAISLVTSGLVNRKNKKILEVPHLPWRDIRIERELRPELDWFKGGIYLERDAIAATLAEQRFGQETRQNHFAVLYLGTGIGAGFVLNGKIYRGEHEHAGEIGHTTCCKEGMICGCGSKGCLECYGSGWKLVKLVREKIRGGNDSLLIANSLFRHVDIIDAADNGDNVAIDALLEMGESLGVGIRNLQLTLDLERIIISGPLAQGWQHYKDSIYASMRTGMRMIEDWTPEHLVVTELADPEVYGAVASYLEQKQ